MKKQPKLVKKFQTYRNLFTKISNVLSCHSVKQPKLQWEKYKNCADSFSTMFGIPLLSKATCNQHNKTSYENCEIVKEGATAKETQLEMQEVKTVMSVEPLARSRAIGWTLFADKHRATPTHLVICTGAGVKPVSVRAGYGWWNPSHKPNTLCNFLSMRWDLSERKRSLNCFLETFRLRVWGNRHAAIG